MTTKRAAPPPGTQHWAAALAGDQAAARIEAAARAEATLERAAADVAIFARDLGPWWDDLVGEITNAVAAYGGASGVRLRIARQRDLVSVSATAGRPFVVVAIARAELVSESLLSVERHGPRGRETRPLELVVTDGEIRAHVDGDEVGPAGLARKILTPFLQDIEGGTPR